ncbi:MAG: nucleotidyl transferase AbiEii/AbiGii toxin family protein [Bacilli bacterium]|nr:nucleotidyl transferase AbiEii/AbiGii toxin family protein [Bacilli bacterium]MDD2681570.1 nucleotidyl transferase AbiEii/AbiGii toxin family protein [Bacilli bacterium]MDD4482726.1 nucleotidyl transferase AbiEii/AbiGii toxin family protein [Bacilli bacterium]
MLLHKDKDVFQELVTATASDLGLENFQVEKDYYVSLFLKELAKLESNISIVFKGGTSLSKCYSIIDRFSEDIDLAVQFKSAKVTSNERKQLKKSILEVIKVLNMTLLNEGEVRSGKDHNEYQIGYSNTFFGDSTMVPHIIVETIVVYRPYPCVNLSVSNYVTKFLTKSYEEQLIAKYELDPFEMLIQSVERTFVDKLFAICDYHLESKYNRYSRHIYDIHMIWSSGKLDMELMKSIVTDVVIDRQRYCNRNLSCQPGAKPGEILTSIIERNVYKNDYNEVTSKFIYKMVEYSVVIKSLMEIIHSNIIPNHIETY